MSWRRLRNLALSQVRAIKDRLDQLDLDDQDAHARERNAREAALRELDDEVGLPPLRPAGVEPRTMTGPDSAARGVPSEAASPPTESQASLSRAYRILGVKEGADLDEVETAYRKLAERCRTVDFDEGSEEKTTAAAIMVRVDEAYNLLREALNPAAGRFDKLEL
jgi:hypothetical protein